jgi:hypothetical protein
VSEREETPDSTNGQPSSVQCPEFGQAESGDDVRDNAVGELLDLIFERQLPLLHPGELKLVAIARHTQQLNLFLETPVFRLEQSQNFPRIIIIHALILQEASIAVTRHSVIGRPRV